MTYSMGFRLAIIVSAVIFMWPIHQARAEDNPMQWNGYITARGLDVVCSPEVKTSETLFACSMYLMGIIDNDRFRARSQTEEKKFCIPENTNIKKVLENISTQLHVKLLSDGYNLVVKDGEEIPQLAAVMIRLLMMEHYPCPAKN
jgi:Rap1a immunity proteins